MNQLFEPFLTPGSRTYWPALIIFSVIWLGVNRAVQPKKVLVVLKRWFSDSSVHLDVQLFVFNRLWRALAYTWVGVLTWKYALGVVKSLDLYIGRLEVSGHPITLIACYSLVLFVLDDLTRFVVHLAMHRVPWLWKVHQIHHSATQLNPLTFFRLHPVESVLYQARAILSTGTVAGVFYWGFRESLMPWQILGVPAIGLVLNSLFGNLRHSTLFIRFPRFFEQWFISPAQHQIHHSVERKHWDSNYGTWLAIWDRWIGTLKISNTPPKQFGVLEIPSQPSLLGALGHPFQVKPTALIALSVGLLFIGRTAIAEDVSSDDDGVSAEVVSNDEEVSVEIIVYGDAQQIKEPGSAHKINEQVLEQYEFTDIQQILSFVPGVSTRTEDGFGLRPNIGIRGANSDRSAKVTLMEDGVLFAPAPYAAPAAYYFPMSIRLTGVEVFKGAASTRYGPQTVGGAINLLTRSIPNQSEYKTELALGAYNTFKAHTYAGGYGKNGWGVLTEVSHLQSDGFKELANGESTGFYRTEAMIKVAKKGGIQFKIGYGTERSQETYLGLSTTDFEKNPLLRYPASQEGLMKWHRGQLETRWNRNMSDDWSIQVGGYYHYLTRAWQKFNRFAGPVDVHNLLIQDPTGGEGAVYLAILRGESDSLSPEEMVKIGTNDRQFHSGGIQATSVWDQRSERFSNRLELGLRVHGDVVQRTHTERSAAMIAGVLQYEDSTTETLLDTQVGAIALATYAHNDFQIGSWHIFPSIRNETIQTTSDVSQWTSPILRSVWLPGAGILKEMSDWTDLFVSVHQGFSPVSPEQPEAVLPEMSWNYELGVRQQMDYLHTELIVFVNDYQRIVGQCTLSSGCDVNDLGRQFTGGRALTSGLEGVLSGDVRLPNSWRLPIQSQYSYTDATFQENFYSGFSQFGSVREGYSLPYVSKHRGSVSIGLVTEKLDASILSVYRGRMLDSAGDWSLESEGEIPSLWTMDAASTQRWKGQWSTYCTINNLTNRRQVASWRPFGARPIAPRTVFLGVQWGSKQPS